MNGNIEKINLLEAEDGKTSTLQSLTFPRYEGMRMPLVEQLAEDIENLRPKWKQWKVEEPNPDKVSYIMVMYKYPYYYRHQVRIDTYYYDGVWRRLSASDSLHWSDDNCWWFPISTFPIELKLVRESLYERHERNI